MSKKMSLIKSLCFSPLAILVLLTTSAWGQKVGTDYDHAANFSSYRTYAWAKGTPAENPLINQRIIEDIETNLSAKGLQKVENAESADLLIAYHAARDTETQINTYGTGGWGGGWGWGWGGGGGMSTTSVDKIPVGKLIVDMADVKNKRFVWRGTASATINSNPEKAKKTLDKALTKMFQKYPPQPKK